MLRLGRRNRRGTLRQDGAQRHRVRRHADHLRGVSHNAGSSAAHAGGNERDVRRVEQERAELVPDRDHERYTQVQGREGLFARTHQGHGRSERHRQVDGDRRPGLRRPSHADRRICVRQMPVCAEGRTCGGEQDTNGSESGVRGRQETVPRELEEGHLRREDYLVRAGLYAAKRGCQGSQLELELRWNSVDVARWLYHKEVTLVET